MEYIVPAAVFDGNELLGDAALVAEDGVVVDLVGKAVAREHECTERPGEILSTGLFDTQVNGGGGVMLNNSPTREGVRRIAQAHRAAGTTYLLPTVITDEAEVIHRAAVAVMEEVGRGGVLGIHIEGPHISRIHKGTHDPDRIRPFDAETRATIEMLRRADVPVLLTLAPEEVPPGLIAELTGMGVVVSAGHTAADADTARRAIAEGLRACTHLYNAMPKMESRKPMATGAFIDSGIWCGFIADGHHVSDIMLDIAVRARPVADRMVLVSDAMSTIGGPDHFELYGERIHVSEGRLVNAEGSLAGAHIDLRTSVRRLLSNFDFSTESVLRMAMRNPFEMMRIDPPKLVGSAVVDLASC
ncbi:MAG: amidohydrolase family protein [Geminicoccaceae bacterium]